VRIQKLDNSLRDRRCVSMRNSRERNLPFRKEELRRFSRTSGTFSYAHGPWARPYARGTNSDRVHSHVCTIVPSRSIFARHLSPD